MLVVLCLLNVDYVVFDFDYVFVDVDFVCGID